MAKGFSPPPVHFSSHHFLTLSIFAYTKFYTRPSIAVRHNQKTALSSGWLDCTVGISVFPDVMTGDRRANALLTPAVFGLVDPSETSFILEHQAHFSTISTAIVDFRLQFLHFFFNFFEVTITSSLAFFGCLRRGITFLQPCRRST